MFSRGNLSSSLGEVHVASDDVLQRQLVIVTGGSTLASGLLVTRDSATTSRNATTATQTSSLSLSLRWDGDMRVPTVESPQLLKSSLVEPELVSTQPSRASAYCEEFCLSTFYLPESLTCICSHSSSNPTSRKT